MAWVNVWSIPAKLQPCTFPKPNKNDVTFANSRCLQSSLRANLLSFRTNKKRCSSDICRAFQKGFSYLITFRNFLWLFFFLFFHQTVTNAFSVIKYLSMLFARSTNHSTNGCMIFGKLDYSLMAKQDSSKTIILVRRERKGTFRERKRNLCSLLG